MTADSSSVQLARQLQQIAAEFDHVARDAHGLGRRIAAALGGSTTQADQQMLAGLSQVSGSARQAQQALSAAAATLHR
jgi:hypothetical protein